MLQRSTAARGAARQPIRARAVIAARAGRKRSLPGLIRTLRPGGDHIEPLRVIIGAYGYSIEPDPTEA